MSEPICASSFTTTTLTPIQRILLARNMLHEENLHDRTNEDDSETNGTVHSCLTQIELLRHVNEAESFIPLPSLTTTDVVRVQVDRYGIVCTWGLLRHVYLRISDVELHAGMTDDNSRQMVYSTRNFYGHGRCESYVVYNMRELLPGKYWLESVRHWFPPTRTMMNSD